jgi:HAE1 family hydrophobic/amphiphilic exporter-1
MKYGLKLLLILLIAGALVFGIMASQFESFLDPFIIIFTVPLTLIGVAIIYFITFEQLNILALVGLVVLVGIVVNNGIVLVDYTNLLVRRGMGIIEACVEAGKNRLRPILMTTLTTVLGLLPMAVVKVEGAEMSRPIAKTVVGGLTVGTIFTLFLVPVIYSSFNQMAFRRKEKKMLKRQEQLEIRREKLKQRGQQ